MGSSFAIVVVVVVAAAADAACATIVSKLEIPSSLIPPKIPRRDAPTRKLREGRFISERAARSTRERAGGCSGRGTYTGRKCVRIRRSVSLLVTVDWRLHS